VHHADQRLTPAELGAARAQCERQWRENNCQALRDSLPENERHKVIDCSQPESYAPLRAVVGVAHGLGEFVVDTADLAEKAANLSGFRGPINQYRQARDLGHGVADIVRAARESQKCNEDEEYKRRLIEQLPPTQRNQGTTAQLMGLTCSELGARVDERLAEIRRDIDVKRLTRQRDYETYLNSLNNRFPDRREENQRRADEYIPREKRELNPDQQYILDNDQRRRAVRENWAELNRYVSERAACFTTQEKARLIARVAAEVFSPTVPLKAVKGAKLAAHMERALAKEGVPAAERIAARPPRPEPVREAPPATAAPYERPPIPVAARGRPIETEAGHESLRAYREVAEGPLSPLVHVPESAHGYNLMDTVKRHGYLIERSNGSTLFHGSDSGGLLAFTRGNGDLIPTGQLLQEGKVPFSGEVLMGAGTRGTNNTKISSVPLAEVDLAIQYTKPTKNPFDPVKTAEELRNPLLRDPDYAHFFGRKAEILERRLEQWRSLTSQEQRLVQERFPVLYGFTHDGRTLSRGTLRDVGGLTANEIGVRDGVPARAIRVIFVPSDRIAEVRQLVHRHAPHVRVMPIEPALSAHRRLLPSFPPY